MDAIKFLTGKVGAGISAMAYLTASPDDADAMTAWHGSPHRFTRFLESKIGSGEGAQAYGHGLYFGERKGVGEFYKESTGNWTIDGKDAREWLSNTPHSAMRLAHKEGITIGEAANKFDEIAPTIGAIDAAISYGKEAERMLAGRPKDLARYRELLESKRLKSTGSLYKVDLKPDDETLLHWDRPLSAQSEYVRNALAKAGFGGPLELKDGMPIAGNARLKIIKDQDFGDKYYMVSPDKSEFRLYPSELENMIGKPGQEPAGKGIYSQIQARFGSEKAASEYLHSIGIPGMKYVDQMSRNADQVTHNYVMFNPKDVKVLERNGKPVVGLREAVKQNSPSLKDMITKMGVTAPVGAIIAEQLAQKRALEAREALVPAINPVEYLTPARWGGGVINFAIDYLLQ